MFLKRERYSTNLTVTDNLLLGIKKGKYSHELTDEWTLERIYNHFSHSEGTGDNKGFQLSPAASSRCSPFARTLMGNSGTCFLSTNRRKDWHRLWWRKFVTCSSKSIRSVLQFSWSSITSRLPLAMAHRLYLMGKAHVGFEGTPEDLAKQPEIKQQYLEV